MSVSDILAKIPFEAQAKIRTSPKYAAAAGLVAVGVAAIVVGLGLLLFAEELRELVSPRDPLGSVYPTIPPPAGARRDIWFWFLRLEENALFIFLGGIILAALGLWPFVSP